MYPVGERGVTVRTAVCPGCEDGHPAARGSRLAGEKAKTGRQVPGIYLQHPGPAYMRDAGMW